MGENLTYLASNKKKMNNTVLIFTHHIFSPQIPVLLCIISEKMCFIGGFGFCTRSLSEIISFFFSHFDFAQFYSFLVIVVGFVISIMKKYKILNTLLDLIKSTLFHIFKLRSFS